MTEARTTSYRRLLLLIVAVTVFVVLLQYATISTKIDVSYEYSDSDALQCFKTNPGDTYQICESLPFTNTDCGNPVERSGDKHLVPNLIHYVWTGNRTFKFHEYLSLRSAASNQKPLKIIFHHGDEKPLGPFWERAEKEIPCLETRKFVAPTKYRGEKIKSQVFVTDVVRVHILLEEGGVYLDTDAMILKSLDPIRKYPFTLGRSIGQYLSSGIMLSEPNSSFLHEWHFGQDPLSKKAKFGALVTGISMQLHLKRPELPIHIEETSIQRPNPYIKGEEKMMNDSYDITNNYFFHIHPRKAIRKKDSITLTLRENELRINDTTYGAAARASLFGTQDLIFLKTEEDWAHNRSEPKKILNHKPMSELFPNRWKT